MRMLILVVALLVTCSASADDEQPATPLLITKVLTDQVVLYSEAFDEVARLSKEDFRKLFFEAVPGGSDGVRVVAPVNPALRMYGVLDKRPAAVASGGAGLVYVEGNAVEVSTDSTADAVCPGSVRALVAEPQKDITTGFGGCGLAASPAPEAAAN